MPPQKMHCYTCGSDEQHRPLTALEKIWLKSQTREKNVEGRFMCTAPSCRNVRTGFNQHPYDPVIRVPLD